MLLVQYQPGPSREERKVRTKAVIVVVTMSNNTTTSNSKKHSYDEALLALTGALSAREKDLEEREKQLDQDRQAMDRDRNSTYGNTAPTDVLQLNIGGVKATILRRTLTSVPDSMLASKFSGRWDDSIEKDKHGHFFIDQEYPLFRHILKYLRNKANVDETYVVQSPMIAGEEECQNYKMHDIYRMIDYYGLTNGMYPVALKVHDGDFVPGQDTKTVNAQEWTTYELYPKGHERRVKTFEVTLGNVQRIQIGWIVNKQSPPYNEEGNDTGIGDTAQTFALDLTRSSYLSEGELTRVDGLEQNKGTVVRSEDYGKLWYVNGNIVAPFSKDKRDLLVTDNVRRPDVLFPFISVKGEIDVTLVEIEK